MIKGCIVFVSLGGLLSVTLGQQTPPVQPKTIDIPKLAKLEPPALPKQNQIIANAPLTAAEAVKFALVIQPQIAIARAAVDAAHGQYLQSASALNPSVTTSATATHSQVQSQGSQGLFGGPTSELSTGIALNKLIFDFNRTRDLVKQSQLLERASAHSFNQTQQDVALQVKQDFYGYVQAQQQAKVEQANVTSRQAQVDLTQAQLNAGLGSPADLVNAKTLASQAVLGWLQAQQAEIIARTKLATDMGIDPRTPLVLVDSVETDVSLPSDTNSLVDAALKQRPSMLAAIQNLQAYGYAVSVARKTDAPSINIQTGLNTLGTSNPFDHQVGFISLTMNWTLIDSGLRLGRVREAQASMSAAGQALRQQSLVVIQQVSDAILGLQAAKQQIPIADAEVGNAQEGVRLAEGRYKAGVATFQEVITAQAALVTAQTDHVNAVTALAVALANLDHATGKWPLN